ncbi:MAG TPA: hypothetical protein ENG92_05085 [Thiolapillus brandeum]|uniref:Uncharacterized protein n=1 Tax=Thiolapillus brandeum TaxID=1076588 RepID=A0A831JY56_9GAMM|nr:hypothetical protein [Thiolapillus brandeum]
MKIIEEILADAQTLRDELALQLKLGTAEAKDEFEKLEPHLHKLKRKTHPIADLAGYTTKELAIAAELRIKADTADDAKTALKLAAEELKDGFEKIKKSI